MTKIKIGIVGASSRIGKSLIQRGCFPLDLDITKPNNVRHVLAQETPHIVVNLASHSDPDWVEDNFEDAMEVNVYGFRDLCVATSERVIPMVTLSTDHIFSGRQYFDWKTKRIIHKGPYKEEYSRPLPVNAYGLTKLGMESIAVAFDNVKIVRTSYLFNRERLKDDIYTLETGHNLKSYPTFICRSFMHVEHFTDTFLHYLQHILTVPQILHISGSLTTSWYNFMTGVADVLDTKYKPKPVYKEREGFAPRPHKGGLKVELSKKLGLPQYDYYDGLKLL